MAGSHDHFPCSSDISMAGISSDQTDAAIMTPDAKPSSNFPSFASISFFMKKTIADPRTVPRKGIAIIIKSFIFSPLIYCMTSQH